jgi:alpha-tubulin suppressor-like RCC1 family protein
VLELLANWAMETLQMFILQGKLFFWLTIRSLRLLSRSVEDFRTLSLSQVTFTTPINLTSIVDGEVLTWGFGKYGRLGNGSEDDQWAPVVVKTLSPSSSSSQRVISVKAGGQFTLAILGMLIP